MSILTENANAQITLPLSSLRPVSAPEIPVQQRWHYFSRFFEQFWYNFLQFRPQTLQLAVAVLKCSQTRFLRDSLKLVHLQRTYVAQNQIHLVLFMNTKTVLSPTTVLPVWL